MSSVRYPWLAGTLLSLAGAGCATTTAPAPTPAFVDWSTLTDGCRSHGLAEVMLFPDELGMELHPTDIRIGRLPDTGNGPGLLVHFRQGRNGIFAQATEPPKIFIAVGDWKRSCSIQINHDACPSAAGIYEDLATRSIPIGHAFDQPTGMTVLHGTTYFLSTRDGHDNQANWSYVGIRHPLQEVLDAALDDLAECSAPAVRAFDENHMTHGDDPTTLHQGREP